MREPPCHESHGAQHKNCRPGCRLSRNLPGVQLPELTADAPRPRSGSDPDAMRSAWLGGEDNNKPWSLKKTPGHCLRDVRNFQVDVPSSSTSPADAVADQVSQLAWQAWGTSDWCLRTAVLEQTHATNVLRRSFTCNGLSGVCVCVLCGRTTRIPGSVPKDRQLLREAVKMNRRYVGRRAPQKAPSGGKRGVSGGNAMGDRRRKCRGSGMLIVGMCAAWRTTTTRKRCSLPSSGSGGVGFGCVHGRSTRSVSHSWNFPRVRVRTGIDRQRPLIINKSFATLGAAFPAPRLPWSTFGVVGTAIASHPTLAASPTPNGS
jgi:hypothetical protein